MHNLTNMGFLKSRYSNDIAGSFFRYLIYVSNYASLSLNTSKFYSVLLYRYTKNDMLKLTFKHHLIKNVASLLAHYLCII